MKHKTVKKTLKMSASLCVLSLCPILFGNQLPPFVWTSGGGVLAPLLVSLLAASAFVSMICFQILLVSTLMIDDAMTYPMKRKAKFVNGFILAVLTDEAKLKHAVALAEISVHKQQS